VISTLLLAGLGCVHFYYLSHYKSGLKGSKSRSGPKAVQNHTKFSDHQVCSVHSLVKKFL
jgi:hypothetical protein